MRRTSLKTARNKRAARPIVSAWLAEQEPRCAVCHKPTELIKKNIHHLVGGFGRRDVPENLLLLCERCHRHYHGEKHLVDGQRLPDLTPGMLMTAKHQADVNHFSLAVICILKHRQSLPPEWYPAPLPTEFIRERERNRR